MLGEHRQALTFCEQALDLHRELRNRHGEANTWDSLGHAHHQLRDYQRAGECYRRAVELFRQIGDRYEEAQTLVRTGDVFEDAGAADAARAAWQAALGILEELDHIDAARIRAKLHSAR
jgi:tetratricopeptide (TPR) repeat protein